MKPRLGADGAEGGTAGGAHCNGGVNSVGGGAAQAVTDGGHRGGDKKLTRTQKRKLNEINHVERAAEDMPPLERQGEGKCVEC